MLGLFRAKLPIDRDEFDWILAVFAWLVQVVDTDEAYRQAPVILSTEDFFPASEAQGHARAIELFDQVRAHAGMRDWPCVLVEGEENRESYVAPGHLLKHEAQPPAGTFGSDGTQVVITYKPSNLLRPADLVATFAHELAHYLLHAQAELPPGGEDLEEHATDVTAVFLGFGAFMANGAKTFAQYQDETVSGWEMRRQGYMSEEALAAALAIFVRMAAEDADAAAAELKDYLRGPFRSTLKVLDREYPDLSGTLRTMDFSDWR